MFTLFNAGKICISDCSCSGSATVGQLEVFTLTLQLELYQSVHLYYEALQCILIVMIEK